MKDLLRKIMENADDLKTVDLSEQGIREAAKRLGYSDAEIEETLKDVDDFPLNDEALENISGGGGTHIPFKIKVQY